MEAACLVMESFDKYEQRFKVKSVRIMSNCVYNENFNENRFIMRMAITMDLFRRVAWAIIALTKPYLLLF